MPQFCPRCQSDEYKKAGLAKGRQRYQCKACGYHYSVSKLGKQIDPYYVVKALQLYLEGLSFREIERILGISHVSISNWVRMYSIKQPQQSQYRPAYEILTKDELAKKLLSQGYLQGHGLIVTELGDKFMVIRWERFRD